MKHLKTLAALCLASLVVCFPHRTVLAEGHHQSGILGQVVWGTWSEEAATPFQCFVSIVSDSGKNVATLETDANGSFQAALKPGTYLLTPFRPFDSGGMLLGPTQRITVEKKDYTVLVMPFGILPILPPGWPIVPFSSGR